MFHSSSSAARACVARIDRRVAGEQQVCLRTIRHTMTCTDVGGRVTDGAGSSVAVEWSDRARTVTVQPLSRWCGCVYKPGWLWPLRMAKRVSKRATRGGERQSMEAPGNCSRAPRPERSVRSVWTRRACFPGACGPGGSSLLGDSTPRWPAGSPAHRPSGRGPGCGFASDRAIPPPSQAGVGFGLGSVSHSLFWSRP